MVFNSLLFALFLLVVLPLVWLLRNRVNARNLLLLLASYVFYGAWDWRFLGLIVISTIVDYCCGLYLGGTHDRAGVAHTARRRFAVLWISVATNLGILGFFKYYDFFITSAADALGAMGVSWNTTTLNFILPVGISFYTFQTLSYTIDAYRRKVPAERNLLTFATFVAFFPQLVAGPIERASHLLPQFRTVRRVSVEAWKTGWYLVAWGLFKKVVIADNLAESVDAVFAHNNPGGLDVSLGVFAFVVQIYCDFSGYTDIARGVARVMGFELRRNFDQPYFAANPNDFWKRWHISLSSWLRDYLYIPLGGNRCGTAKTYRNLMITMLLGGLWHGASWTFVVWGGLHGGALCLHRMLRGVLAKVAPTSQTAEDVWYLLRAAAFFSFWCLTMVFFRADSFSQAFMMFRAVLSKPLATHALTAGGDAVTIAAATATLFFAELYQWRKKNAYALLTLATVPRSIIYAGLFLGFVLFGDYGGEAFIYFQF